MRKLLLGLATAILILGSRICWEAGNTEEEGKKFKPVAEIHSIEPPMNWDDWVGEAGMATMIPVLVKNNTSERVKGIGLILHAYDRQKRKLFESNLVTHWKSDVEAGRWRNNDQSIEKKDVVRQFCLLPERQYLHSKEFEEKYGEPEYFVVELYVEGDLIDVGAEPKRFFKHRGKTDREKRMEEWNKIKSESAEE